MQYRTDMQQLAAQNTRETHAIINHMMGYVPDLHKIWVGTSDQQFMALSREYPGFYRYAHIMEEASEADIEANTVDDDANQEEVLEHTAQQDEPEVESTVDLSDDEEPVIVESEDDEATDAEPTEAEETDTAEENAPEAE